MTTPERPLPVSGPHAAVPEPSDMDERSGEWTERRPHDHEDAEDAAGSPRAAMRQRGERALSESRDRSLPAAQDDAEGRRARRELVRRRRSSTSDGSRLDLSVVDLIAARQLRRRRARQFAAESDQVEKSPSLYAEPNAPEPERVPRTVDEPPVEANKVERTRRFKTRHIVIIATLIGCVFLPAIATAIYMFFIAADQYDSQVSFSVRSLSPAAASSSLLGMITSDVSGTTTSDSFILTQYLQSQQAVAAIDKEIDLRKLFNRQGADWYFRLGAHKKIEDLVSYWNWMVSSSFESSTGIITVDVHAFSPQDARTIAQAILDKSQALVTTLSQQARNDAVSFAKGEVARAEMRLKFANRELQNFRDREQEIDPTANVKVAMDLISALQQQLTSARAEQKQLSGYLNKESPTLQLLNSKISSLEKQLAEEQRVLGTGDLGPVGGGNAAATAAQSGGRLPPKATLSSKVGRFQELSVEQDFAQKAYTSALAAAEKAEVEAAARDRFLATFVSPTVAETAEYPRRVIYTLLIFGALLILWASTVLIVYNIRDRT